MTTTTIIAGDSANGFSVSAGNDGTVGIQVGPNGAKINALAIDASGKPSWISGSGGITSGTAVATTSGTAIDFTGIPSWVKRITIAFNSVSTNGTQYLQVQAGSGSIQNTGYVSQAYSGAGVTQVTGGFVVHNNVIAAQSAQGIVTLVNMGSNVWVQSGLISTSSSGNAMSQSAGVVTLSGVLDRFRVISMNGTDVFDSGSINILYE